jgi:RNA-directed DNA polymerase
MGKRYHHLWPQLVSFTNLWAAFKKGAKGKRSKSAVADFEYHLEANLLQLRTELRTGSYQPGAYQSFTVHDPKKRLISAAPFRDRVVHHALVNRLQPIYERKFIHDTYANRVGKGTHRALDRCTQYLRRFRFVLPMDVQQYFPAIDHAILLATLRQTIADDHVLNLCAQIIASGAKVHKRTSSPIYFPGDDLFAATRPRSLPIGNMTSQFWANVYLNGLDHFIKRQLKCPGYIRYVDDMLLFADTKAELHHWRAEVIQYMAGLRLTIHTNRAQPRPTKIGIPFLGFQVFPNHRRLKRRNALQARRRLKTRIDQYQQGEIDLAGLDASVQSWANHASHGDTWRLRKALFTDLRIPPPNEKGTDAETITPLQ